MPPLLVLLRRHQWQLTRHSIACDTAAAKQRQIRTIVSILSIVSIINDFSTKIPQWATAIAVDYTSCRLCREIFLTQVAMRYPNPCGAVISVRKITERQCTWNLFKWTRTRTCSQRNSDSNLQSAELGLEPAVSRTRTRTCSQRNTDSNMQSAKLGLEPAVRGTRTLTCSQQNSDSPAVSGTRTLTCSQRNRAANQLVWTLPIRWLSEVLTICKQNNFFLIQIKELCIC